MKPVFNIILSSIFIVAALFVFGIVISKQDFSTYGIVIIASSVLLVVLFGMNILWTIRNIRKVSKDDETKGQDSNHQEA